MLSISLNGYLSQKITKQVTNYASYICCCSFAGDRKSNSLLFLNSTKNLYIDEKKSHLSYIEKEGLKLNTLGQPIVSWLYLKRTAAEISSGQETPHKPIHVLKIKTKAKTKVLKEPRHSLRILASLELLQP